METETYKQEVAGAFDAAAATYDRLGVEFFTPMGSRLVELADPGVGERVLDVGCGRGACLFPAADRVGPSGRVLGIDIAPGMVEEAHAEAERRGLAHVETAVMDAESPGLPRRGFDVVMGSYSVIFFPEALSALRSLGDVLVDQGRFAFTSPVFQTGTFPFLPPEFTPWIPQELLDHLPPPWRPEALVARFNSWLERVPDLTKALNEAGYRDVRVHDEPVRMTAPSPVVWVEWSHTQGMRLLWTHLPEPQRVELRERLLDGLSGLCGADGSLAIDVPVRFVTATVDRERMSAAQPAAAA